MVRLGKERRGKERLADRCLASYAFRFAKGQKRVNVSRIKDECPTEVLISRPHRGVPDLPRLFHFSTLPLLADSTEIPGERIVQVPTRPRQRLQTNLSIHSDKGHD